MKRATSDFGAALDATGDGVLLRVRVSPRAKADAIAGLHGGAVRVRLSAVPVDGKANKALVAYLAALLAVPSRDVTVVRGASSRDKLLHVAGVGVDAAAARLAMAKQ